LVSAILWNFGIGIGNTFEADIGIENWQYFYEVTLTSLQAFASCLIFNADDTQIYGLTVSLSDNVSAWLTANMLQLNPMKTERCGIRRLGVSIKYKLD